MNAQRGLLCAAALLFGFGCQQAPSDVPASEVHAVQTSESHPSAFVPAIDYLPQMKNPETDIMLTTISGRLIVRNGCLTIARGDRVYVIIWPSAARLESASSGSGNYLIVPQGPTQPAELLIGAESNVTLVGGGGERSAEFTTVLRAPLPAACVGPIWRAQEVKLAST